MISGEWTLAVSCLFDATILWVTSRFMYRRIRRWRWLYAVAVGQLPTLWVLIGDRGYAEDWQVVFLAWPCLMVALAFGRLTRREWLRAMAVFSIATVLAGGLMLALGQGRSDGLGTISSEGWTGLVTLGVLWLVAWRGPTWWRQSSQEQMRISELEIQLNQATVFIRVLWDSGNLLRDPVSKCPVIIVELSSVWQALDDEELTWALAVLAGHWPKGSEERGDARGVVQFDSLGGRGYIPTFRPERVRAWNTTSGWISLLPTRIGLVSRPMSESGRYQALASPDCQPQTEREGVMGA